MSYYSVATKISDIKNRYFVYSKRQILHIGDCNIFRSRKNFCNCGLLHDLEILDFILAEILYPKYGDDIYLQECGGKRTTEQKNIDEKEARRILEEVFGPIKKSILIDLRKEYDYFKKLIKSCFTKREFPLVFNRLDDWFKNEYIR